MSQDDESKCNTAYQYFKCAKPLDFSYRNLVSLEGIHGSKLLIPIYIVHIDGSCVDTRYVSYMYFSTVTITNHRYDTPYKFIT